MEMRILSIAIGMGVLIGGSAFGALPRDAMNEITVTVYGMYTSDDPNCGKNLQATVPLSLTGMQVNMAGKPNLGNGPMPSNPKCVVMVMNNSVTMSWKGGNYYTSTILGGTTNSDSACNTAGSVTKAICGTSTAAVLTWPAAIQADLSKVGINVNSTCTGSTSEVIPVFLSVNSICKGNSSDPSGCNSFAAPGGQFSLNGVALNTPGTASKYKFVIDPSETIGATASNACGNVAAPTFSFKMDSAS